MCIEQLVGKQLVSIVCDDAGSSDVLIFTCDDGDVFRMEHSQYCCESVDIEDICGDLNDLLKSPILSAEETSNSRDTDWGDEEWTFYHIRNMETTVTIRWYGSSNGYYSTSVSFYKVNS